MLHFLLMVQPTLASCLMKELPFNPPLGKHFPEGGVGWLSEECVKLSPYQLHQPALVPTYLSMYPTETLCSRHRGCQPWISG